MSAPTGSTRTRGQGALTLALAGAALSATGAPTPKTLAYLVGLGLPDLAARALLHILPVILIALAIVLGRALGSGRSRTVRWVIYGLAGMLAGFCTAFCLDLFAGVPVLIEKLNGPLSEAGLVEIGLWSMGSMSGLMAVMVAAIAVFGSPAARALAVEDDINPEFLEVRRAERRVYGLSALGLVTQGLAIMALAVARQSQPEATLAPGIVALTSAWVSAVISYVLWRGFDELQRRQVTNGYASSAIVVSLGTFVWAVAQAAGYLPAIDAGGVFLVLTLVQTVVILVVTSAALGGQPAAPRRRAA